MNSLAASVALRKAEQHLVARLQALEDRLQAGDDSVWPDVCETVTALAAVAPALQPENGGPMLTTAAMAARLGVTAKALLRRKAKGQVKPTVEAGKLLRWNGREALR